MLIAHLGVPMTFRSLVLILSATFVFAACGNSTPDAAAPAAAPEAVKADADHGHDHGDHDHGDAAAVADQQDSECTCADGKKGATVWCDHCNHGYVAGAKVEEKAVVDTALAAMAHAGKADAVLDGDDQGCTCSAGKDGGTVWCDHCNKGYIAGVSSDDKIKVMAAVAAAK